MENETITAEERAAQIFAATAPDANTDLTNEDELNIILGKGIEYVLSAPGKDDLKIYIAPLKISQYELFFEACGVHPEESLLVNRKRQIVAISKILSVPIETLEDYMDVEDPYEVVQLMLYGIHKGKSIFGKKKIPMSEIKNLRNSLEKIGMEIQKAGSQTT